MRSKDLLSHDFPHADQRQHDAILDALSFISTHFLRNPDFATAVNESLQRLGEAANVSRVYIAEHCRDAQDHLCGKIIYEWLADGIAPSVAGMGFELLNYHEMGLQRLEGLFESGQQVYGLVKDALPIEQKYLLPQGLKSYMILPILLKGHPWGHIGFDECKFERAWTAVEIDALTAVTGVFGAALENRQIAQALGESQSRYHDLFENTPVALSEQDFSGAKKFLNDLRARGIADVHAYLKANPAESALYMSKFDVLDANRATLDLYEAPTKADWVNDFLNLFGDFNLLMSREEVEAVADGRPTFDLEKLNYTLTGKLMDIILRWAVLPGYEQDMAHVIVSVTDVTQRKRAEAALRERESRNKALLEAIPDLLFVFDREGRYLECYFASASDLFHQPEILLGKKMSEVLPADVAQKLTYSLELAFRTGLSQNMEYDLEINGQRSTYESRMVAVEGDTVISIVRNITARKRNEQALVEMQDQLAQRIQELENRSQEIEILTEMVNLLQVCSETAEALMVIRRFIRRIFPTLSGAFLLITDDGDHFEVRDKWGEVSLAGDSFLLDECWAVRRGRIYFAREANGTPLCQHIGYPIPSSYLCLPVLVQGQVFGLLHLQTPTGMAPITTAHQQLAANVSEQISMALSNLVLREKLHLQAVQDQLTGLFNYSYMEMSLERELHSAQHSAKPMSLIMFDLDHFKDLNTQFGHPRVNMFLRDFGLLLQQFERTGDITCRYGGDEFIVILPETGLAEAAELAEKLRQHIKTLTLQKGNQPQRGLTASIGVAASPDHGQTVEELLEAVDDAVYQAKATLDCVKIARTPAK